MPLRLPGSQHMPRPAPGVLEAAALAQGGQLFHGGGLQLLALALLPGLALLQLGGTELLQFTGHHRVVAPLGAELVAALRAAQCR